MSTSQLPERQFGNDKPSLARRRSAMLSQIKESD